MNKAENDRSPDSPKDVPMKTSPRPSFPSVPRADGPACEALPTHVFGVRCTLSPPMG